MPRSTSVKARVRSRIARRHATDKARDKARVRTRKGTHRKPETEGTRRKPKKKGTRRKPKKKRVRSNKAQMMKWIDSASEMASQLWKSGEVDDRAQVKDSDQRLLQRIREVLDLPPLDPEGTLLAAAEELGITLSQTTFEGRLLRVCKELQMDPEDPPESDADPHTPQKVSGVQQAILQSIREDLGLDTTLDPEETLQTAAEDLKITLPLTGFQGRLLRVCQELGIVVRPQTNLWIQKGT
jgi:hypothetical protein